MGELIYFVYKIMDDGSKRLVGAFVTECDVFDYEYGYARIVADAHEGRMKYIREHFSVSCVLGDQYVSPHTRGIL